MEPGPSPAICPYDLCPVDGADAVVCPGCSHQYHRECWEELGGCAVMGCPRMVEVKKPAQATPTYWGTTQKACPFCAETIAVGATECPYCRSVFDDIRPLSRESILPKQEDPRLAEYRTQAKWLLFFSIIGCTSPLALLIGLVWYRRNRKEITRAGGVTNGLAVAALLIAGVYLIMLGVGVLVFQIGNHGK